MACGGLADRHFSSRRRSDTLRVTTRPILAKRYGKFKLTGSFSADNRVLNSVPMPGRTLYRRGLGVACCPETIHSKPLFTNWWSASSRARLIAMAVRQMLVSATDRFGSPLDNRVLQIIPTTQPVVENVENGPKTGTEWKQG